MISTSPFRQTWGRLAQRARPGLPAGTASKFIVSDTAV
jgi:hypothetical protein